MNDKSLQDQSLSEVHSSVDTTRSRRGWRKIFAFLGPAYLVSVGYMDPGNWATDLQGGSKFGYSLIWVLLMSNIMALLLQGLSARLGIVRGRDLAQANREAYPKPINFVLYLLAELAIAACDLAEVLGMAIGIKLLTGLPLIWGVSITILDTFLLLFLQKLGIRKMEAFIIALVAIVSFSFLIQIIIAQPDPAEIVKGFVPHLPNNEALYIAIGIIGATVMPHNLYLHSALVQTRKIDRDEFGIKQALRFNRIDSTIALNVAFLVNAAILILAATTFNKTGNAHVGEIEHAHELLHPLLGSTLAPTLFAIALIAAGQSSTITGTLAGQIVMEGYLSLRINPWARRLLTRLLAIVPALVVILIYGEKQVDSLLVLSQVILSLQLGFAVIPLIHFVSDKKTMGQFAIKPITRIAAWCIAGILIFLNIKMLVGQVIGDVLQSGNTEKILLTIGISAAFLFLLGYILFYPFIVRQKRIRLASLHHASKATLQLELPEYKNIAIALDFSNDDPKLLAHALAQGREDTQYFIIHVVESAPAQILGRQTDDFETRRDKEQLAHYIAQLRERGYQAKGALGYHNRVTEIVRLVEEQKADLLVIGAHGHSGLKDMLYGQTVNSVRHELKIPVLIVNV